jgi:hypothetical protein
VLHQVVPQMIPVATDNFADVFWFHHNLRLSRLCRSAGLLRVGGKQRLI